MENELNAINVMCMDMAKANSMHNLSPYEFRQSFDPIMKRYDKIKAMPAIKRGITHERFIKYEAALMKVLVIQNQKINKELEALAAVC